jgi:hypothetical protein
VFLLGETIIFVLENRVDTCADTITHGPARAAILENNLAEFMAATIEGL